jgi:cytochrome c
VQAKAVLRPALISVGIALLFAGLFFDMGLAASPRQQSATPTPDRLAQPTLPPSPSQADHGAQVYWLSCLPCHGDKGQGLTDEFRAVYPPEDQYCWDSGCHGKRPYEDGFTIPTVIPAVIGQGNISKFSNAAQLNSYIRAAMPFWKPGSLTEEEAWSVTAFILRESGLWTDDVELNETNATEVKIPPVTPQQAQVEERGGFNPWLVLAGLLLILFLLFFILKKNQNKATI